MLAAPCDPPLTSRVCPSSGSPKDARAADRPPTRSSSVIPARNGSPMHLAPGSGVSRKDVKTWSLNRAASRLASPGSAFCSWMTIGILRRRAAR